MPHQATYTALPPIVEAAVNSYDYSARIGEHGLHLFRRFSVLPSPSSVLYIPECISLNHPYAAYPRQPDNARDANNARIDRNMVDLLGSGRISDLNATLVWIQQVSERPNVQALDCKAEIHAAAQSISQYYCGANNLDTIRNECMPLLRRCVPHAFSNAQEQLQKCVTDYFFSNLAATAPSAQHVVMKRDSSVDLAKLIAKAQIPKGAKVIFPTPTFEPFATLLYANKATLITTDTSKTDFKLRAEDLEKLIHDHHMGKNDWLWLAMPDNVTMTTYSRNELQAIADVIARTGIHVVCDELYARMDNKPHLSLATFSGYGPQGMVPMHDRVTTIAGCSKQFAFGSDHKLAVAWIADPDKAAMIRKSMHHGICDKDADMFHHLITSHPGHIRNHCITNNARDGNQVRHMIAELNERYLDVTGEPAFEYVGSPNAYLGGLRLNHTWAEKLGIHDGNELYGYLIATLNIDTRSLAGEGIREPMVRINLNQVAQDIETITNRLDTLLDAVKQGTAPHMDAIATQLERESQKARRYR